MVRHFAARWLARSQRIAPLGRADARDPRTCDRLSSAPAYRLPPSLVVLFPAIVCTWLGGMGSADGHFSITALPPSAVIGGCIGLILGLAVYLDNRAVQRRIEAENQSTALDLETATQLTSVADRHSNAIAVLMLVLPIVAGTLIWQREMMHLTAHAARLLGAATVISTALLGYYDMRLLVVRSRSAPPPANQPFSPPVGALWAF